MSLIKYLRRTSAATVYVSHDAVVKELGENLCNDLCVFRASATERRTRSLRGSAELLGNEIGQFNRVKLIEALIEAKQFTTRRTLPPGKKQEKKPPIESTT